MRLFLCSFVVVAALAVALPASAQVQGPRSERPYRGLFAGGTGNAQQLLTFTASGGGGYDDDIFQQGIGTGVPNGAGGSTSFITGSAGLGYSLSKRGMAFSASFGSGTGYYPRLNQPTLVHYNGGVGAGFQVAKHSTLSINQAESYQPLYFFAWLPTGVPDVEVVPQFDPGTMTLGDAVQAASLTLHQPLVADVTAASNIEYYLTSETNVGFTQGLTQHLTLNAGYGYRRTDSKSQGRDYNSRSWSGSLSYGLGKGVAIHGGYTYGETRYEDVVGPSSDYTGHTIDAGVSYNKALSFSRRTTMGFSTGTAAINDGIQTHYSLTGDVHLSRELGRTWATGIAYSRQVSFVETFHAPVLTDSVSANVGGLLSHETQFEAFASVSRGDVGYVSNNNYETYVAGAGIRRGLSRHLGISGHYTIYRYTFASGILLPPGLADRAYRQSFSFSVDFWTPIIQKNRSGNATR